MNEQAPMMNQQQHQQQHLMNVNPSMMSANQMSQQPQPQMVPPMNRGYGWPMLPQFQKLNPSAMKPPLPSFKNSLGPRNNWKGKRVNKPKDKRRNNDLQKSLISGSIPGNLAGGVNIIGGSGGRGAAGGLGNMNFNGYQPPTLNELQQQNQLKARKFFPKKKFNKNNMNMNMNMNMVGSSYNYFHSRNAPYAPRNTTSFLIRAKKSGGIASLVSPSPMTPAVLPTPIFSPSREVLVDMAKEEWGVDGYGSMKGLIRLRSPGHDEEEEEGGSSESDVEEHVEVERRLDHDLSRFEMIFNPNSATTGGMDFHSVLENRVDDQFTHIAHLEEENLILKERLFLMERELGDLRRRMQFLESRGNGGDEIIPEEVVENESENESGSHGEEGAHSVGDNNEGFGEDNVGVCKGTSDDDLDLEMETADKNVEKELDLMVGDGEGRNKVCGYEGEGENNECNEFVGTNNKTGNEFYFGKEAENKDGIIDETDENSKVTETEGEEEDNNDESVDADTVEGNNKVVKEIEDKSTHEESKHEVIEVKATNNIDAMEEVEVIEYHNEVLSKDHCCKSG